MIGYDFKLTHQPLPARVHFIRPWEPTDKRGVYVYTDTEVAMALQQVDDQDDLTSFNDMTLQSGASVRVEGETFIIRKVEVQLYNTKILGNHHSYPLSFDSTDANSGFVLSIEVQLDIPPTEA